MDFRLSKDIGNSIEAIKGKLYFSCLEPLTKSNLWKKGKILGVDSSQLDLSTNYSYSNHLLTQPVFLFLDKTNTVFFSIDSALVYEPFYKDFGPLSLGHLYSFVQIIKDLLSKGKQVYLITAAHDPQKKLNAACLFCLFLIIEKGFSPEQAFGLFKYVKPPLIAYRDVSRVEYRRINGSAEPFTLNLFDCCKAVKKALICNFLNFSNFSLNLYYYYERIENGDLNWILPNKILAFSGPHSTHRMIHGIRTMTPSDYIPYFRENNVSAVIRLNKKQYNARSFTQFGINHYDLFFPDGSNPPFSILTRFLEIFENEPGAIAIHCKAGLGRTGTLICAALMKHFFFSPGEAIAWTRICRPGSVIGPQQDFLHQVQQKLEREGDIFRKHALKIKYLGPIDSSIVVPQKHLLPHYNNREITENTIKKLSVPIDENYLRSQQTQGQSLVSKKLDNHKTKVSKSLYTKIGKNNILVKPEMKRAVSRGYQSPYSHAYLKTHKMTPSKPLPQQFRPPTSTVNTFSTLSSFKSPQFPFYFPSNGVEGLPKSSYASDLRTQLKTKQKQQQNFISTTMTNNLIRPSTSPAPGKYSHRDFLMSNKLMVTPSMTWGKNHHQTSSRIVLESTNKFNSTLNVQPHIRPQTSLFVKRNFRA